MTDKKPEILAPAGTYEAMEAAVKAGCDAVYAGGSLFSARAYAGNFDESEFLKAIDFCHLFGVKVYMTLNTLLKEDEIKTAGEAVVKYVAPYYKAGLDAVLIQDMGVLKTLRENFPDLPVHSSTQMSITSSYGARLASELGFERIVPARELSLKEILSIKENSEIEIETFVHGAMCFSYSGKCLFSSFAGGRSGNRGRCAQPCRQCYRLLNSEKNRKNGEPRIQEYLMSLKDLCMLEQLPFLIDAGIDSFKIEGRMKNPCYVASAVSAYRMARDEYLEQKEKENAGGFDALSEYTKNKYKIFAGNLQDELAEIYNRGGFYSGYYFTEKGKEMGALKRPNHQGVLIGTVVSVKSPQVFIRLEKDLNKGDVLEIRNKGSQDIELTSGRAGNAGEKVSLNGKNLKQIRTGMEVWRTRNEKLLSGIEESILKTEKTIPVLCEIRAYPGENLKIRLETAEQKADDCRMNSDHLKNKKSVSITVFGDLVETAQNMATSQDVLIEKMNKSGGSGVEIISVSCNLSENAFVRMSAFNELRRKAAAELKKTIAESFHRA
ncbi:MAG: U32 family peptidase [Parasporobacterium sp.]|nr:U32 family peptidase [Parasporobacterium sp.]